jgi:hypothetical protein
MHAMTLATTCSHAWSAQCVIIVAPMSARHGYITADWSHPFADPDAAARQPSPAPNGGGLDVTLSGPQQRVLNSLATWKQIREAPPSNAQVAWLAQDIARRRHRTPIREVP